AWGRRGRWGRPVPRRPSPGRRRRSSPERLRHLDDEGGVESDGEPEVASGLVQVARGEVGPAEGGGDLRVGVEGGGRPVLRRRRPRVAEEEELAAAGDGDADLGRVQIRGPTEQLQVGGEEVARGVT